MALKRFIDSFKAKLHYLAKADAKKYEKPASIRKRQTPKSASGKPLTSTYNSTVCYSSSDDEQGNSGQVKSGTYAETSSIYQINKILSSDNYTVGKNVQHYLNCF